MSMRSFYFVQNDDFLINFASTYTNPAVNLLRIITDDPSTRSAEEIETEIANKLNNNTPEFLFHIDPNDSVSKLPSSKYFTVDQFNTIRCAKENDLLILNVNIRSLIKNFDKLH